MKEALKLALEVLKGLKSMYGGNGHKLHEINMIHRKHDTAITALEEALAQQEKDEFVLRGILAKELKCWHRLTADEAQNLMAFIQNMVAMQAQPEQEPVAWMWVVDGKPRNVTFGGANSNTPKDWTALPLYTCTPPQRKADHSVKEENNGHS